MKAPSVRVSGGYCVLSWHGKKKPRDIVQAKSKRRTMGALLLWRVS